MSVFGALPGEVAPRLGPLLGWGLRHVRRGPVPNGPPIVEKMANIRKTENRNSAIGETKLARCAGDVAPGQLAGPPGQQRQGPPQFAVEMEDAVGEVVPEGGQRPVDVPRLAATVAMGADQRGSAIEAGAVALPLPFAGADGSTARAASPPVTASPTPSRPPVIIVSAWPRRGRASRRFGGAAGRSGSPPGDQTTCFRIGSSAAYVLVFVKPLRTAKRTWRLGSKRWRAFEAIDWFDLCRQWVPKSLYGVSSTIAQ